MKSLAFRLFSLAWLACALALSPVARAQSDAPPATPAPALAAPPPAPPPDAPAVAPVPADTPVAPAPAEAAPAEDADLRELGTAVESAPAAPAPPVAPRKPRVRVNHDGPPFGSHTIGKDATQSEAISILGDSKVDGHVRGEAVSVLGSTTVNGRVDGAAVSVMGTTTVNGSVGGEAVAVFGDVVLGPGAEIGGEAVAVFGRVIRADDATVGGGVTEVAGLGHLGDFRWLRTWASQCLFWGRPLWIGPGLGWAWAVAAGFVLFYMLLALLFPQGVERCAELLETRPGNTILAALLTALLTPVLIVLLAITGVGLALVPFLFAGLFLGSLFGKATVLAWFGRRITPLLPAGRLRHVVVAVFFGGILVALLYLIPFLGFLLWKFFGVLGLGAVIYALILATRRERAAAPSLAPPPAAGSAPAAAMASAAVAPASEAAFGTVAPEAAPVATFAAPPPPVPVAPVALPGLVSAATLPRAGFWLRLAAGLLDFILVGIAAGFLGSIMFRHEGPGFIFLAFAAYSAAMWKHKGTTIGGIICGLKVVRLDDRPIDWSIAFVRSLSGFLSFFPAGLGFIWVAFDDEKQSWHDKIAGTTIVRVPKGTALL